MVRLTLLLVIIYLITACSPEKKESKYNLLFILTDEQRYDTSLPYGNDQVMSPHLNQLGSEALVFEKAYVTQPVCSPARSSIMTGYYPHTTHVTANNIPLPDSIPVLPAYFPHSEYATSYIGKWHLGAELDVRTGFDERISTEDGYTATDTLSFSDYHRWLEEKGYKPDVKPWNIFSREFCCRLPYEHTKSKFIEEQALAFLEKQQGQNFILYLAFLEPHTPNFGPFDNLHNPSNIELDPTYGTFVPDEEPLRYKLMRTPSEWRLATETLQEEMAKYWGLVHQVDLSIGVIIDKLKQLNLYGNTIIVYTSEHGKMMGKFGLGGKSVMYEPSARIPLFIRIPGISPSKINYPVSQIDLVPTLLDAMGQEIPANLPGKSLLPYLNLDQAGNVFVEWHPGRRNEGMISRCPEGYSEEQCTMAALQKIRVVITPNGWKLCQSVEDADRSQLFNLNTDPEESNNLYYRKEYRHVRDSLRSLIVDWQGKVDDPFSL